MSSERGGGDADSVAGDKSCQVQAVVVDPSDRAKLSSVSDITMTCSSAGDLDKPVSVQPQDGEITQSEYSMSAERRQPLEAISDHLAKLHQLSQSVSYRLALPSRVPEFLGGSSQMLGLGDGPLTLGLLADSVHRDDVAAYREFHERVLQGQRQVASFRHLTSDGAVLLLRHYEELVDHDGFPQYVVGFVQNTTNLPLRGLGCEAGLRIIALAQSIAKATSFRINPVTFEVVFSDNAPDFFGLPQGSPITLADLAAVVHPDDRALVSSHLRHVAEHVRSECDFRMIRESGAVTYCRSVLEVVTDTGQATVAYGMVQDVTELTEAIRVGDRLNATLSVISKCQEAMLHATSEDQLIKEVCEAIASDPSSVCVWVGERIYNREKAIRPVYVAGSAAEYVSRITVSWDDVPTGWGPTGTAIKSNRPVFYSKSIGAGYFAPWRAIAADYGITSCISIPVIVYGEALYVLTVYKAEPDEFPLEEREAYIQFAGQVSHGVERLRTQLAYDLGVQELKRQSVQMSGLLDQVVQALANAVVIKDPYTAAHQERVTKLCMAIAEKLHLEPTEQDGLRLAARVHDIGRIMVPSEIRSKPSKLKDVEYELMCTHALASYEILKGIDFPWPVAEIVLQHHERPDGAGYPKGLKEEEIRLEARIIAVADVMEAMCSHRPYRAAIGAEEALNEIRRVSGTQLDPKVVAACEAVFNEGFSF